MVLLNFYLHVIIHYYVTASLDIFYHCFYLQGTSSSRHRQEAFLEALNEGQQHMAGAWSTWLEVRAAQQKASEELDIKDKADAQPHITYILVQF
jgi:hypothetical protein